MERKSAPAAGGLDLTDLASGMYAVPDGDTRLKLKIDVVTDGKWAGWVFVKDAAVYGAGQRYGMQKPGQPYQGKAEAALQEILKNPLAAQQAYGQLTGKCYACNRQLEDEESVRLGYRTHLPQQVINQSCAARRSRNAGEDPLLSSSISPASWYRWPGTA